MKKAFLLLWLFAKRLYKRAAFLTILLLIPLLVLCYSASARQDSGMLTVALASEDGSLPRLESGQLLRFVHCSPQQAQTLVRHGKADTAWVFHDGWQEKVAVFAAEPEQKNAFVTVLVREDSVMLRLSREKLSGGVYEHIARQVAVDFVRENVPGLEGLLDETLLAYYEKTFAGNRLFDYGETGQAQPVHYLTAPLKGMLAVVVVLCGLACAMLWQEDLRRGTFAWMGDGQRSLAELAFQLVALVHVGAAALLALWLSGMASAKEAAVMGAFVVAVACSCAALRRACGSVRLLGTLLPVLVVAMLVVCPVFFDLTALRTVQQLFLPTHYLAQDGWTLLAIAAGALGVYGLLGAAKRA